MKTTKKHISRRLRRFARANEAVSALEYAILVGIIAVAIAGVITAFSGVGSWVRCIRTLLVVSGWK